MAEAITDANLVAALRPFVRATRPVLDGLRESDPFGLRSRDLTAGRIADRPLKDRILDSLAGMAVPGTARWAAMDVDAHCAWWVRRLGRFTTLLAAVPGIGGAFADRLPIQSALGAAGQGLLLCAIAGERGVRDEDEKVALLGSVLFKRDLTKALRAARPSEAEVDARAAELTGEIADVAAGARLSPRKIVGAMWRLGRALYSVSGELEKRPHGRFYHQALGMIPVFGMVGDYFGEWSGLKRAAKAGNRWLLSRPTHPG